MSHSQSCLPLLRAVEAGNSRLRLLCPPGWASGSATAWGARRRGWAAVLSAPRPGLGSGEGGLGRAVEGTEGEGPVDGEGAEGHVLEWLTPQGQKAKQTLTDTPWEMRAARRRGRRERPDSGKDGVMVTATMCFMGNLLHCPCPPPAKRSPDGASQCLDRDYGHQERGCLPPTHSWSEPVPDSNPVLFHPSPVPLPPLEPRLTDQGRL